MSVLIKDKTFVIIPAKDEATRITQVISKTLDEGFTNILVIDDGSSDETGRIAGAFKDVTVLKHWIPKSRVFYNKIGNLVSYFITGVYLTDSQSGIKALSRNFCQFLEIKHNGFEFCIEIIKQAKIANASIKEIPVNVTYTKETMQKGQNLISGFAMVARLLKPF